jgi:hypothetical protein
MEHLTAGTEGVLLRQPLTCEYIGGGELLGASADSPTAAFTLEGEPRIGPSTLVVPMTIHGLRTVLYRTVLRITSSTTEQTQESKRWHVMLSVALAPAEPRTPRTRFMTPHEPDLDEGVSLEDAAAELRRFPVIDAPTNVIKFRFPRSK